MKPKSQEEILQAIHSGNPNNALSYLYATALPKVRLYVQTNSGSREEADDLFQDAVLVFFHQVRGGKYDVKHDIVGFIYTVARNLWIDKVRREKRMVKYDHPNQYEGKSDSQDQLTDLIDEERQEAMMQVFRKLDEKCQKILLYYIFERKSMADICQLMGYSSAHVAKTNHYRCKQYLSKLVKSDAQLVSLLKN